MVLERIIFELFIYFVRDTLPLTLSCILIKMVLESLSLSPNYSWLPRTCHLARKTVKCTEQNNPKNSHHY